jgi:hypothetical protein
VKSNHTNKYGWLFRMSSRLLKYYSYFLLGLLIICLFAAILNLFPIFQTVMIVTGEWILRLLAFLIALVMAATIYESLRF